ncbi:putative odorant receptor 71a [Pseudomyrmex gracilis]|uniref:putative odorant receptor 71a n=1 Tax=Pseudomyrmex gracilis TaxID=219809 RepID=UPI000994DBDE|nr:putative odorant receptor 71a [Pseudomyrmex gracilis]
MRGKQAAGDASLLQRYRAYTRRVHRMLHIGGVLQSRKRPVINSYISGFFVIFTCFSQSVFILNFCRDHTDNLVLLSKCLGLFSSIITPALMAACFLVKRQKLIELHETLNDLVERELMTRDRECRAIMFASLTKFDRLSFILSSLLASATVFFVLPSLINVARQIVHHTEPKRYRLPMPSKFPWSVPTDGGFVFYLHLAYQCVTFWWVMFTIGSVDALFGFYAFQISSMLRAMRHNLTNPRPKDVFANVLRECVQTHRQIVKCSRILEDVWGLIILRMVIANAVLLCTLIFEAMLTEMTVSRVFLFASYIGLKLVQTFTYAWFGSFVTSASEHFREGIYFSEWLNVSLDRHVRTNVIVTMMQKPITLKALKLSSVNVNMFTNMMNTAMSYFFLLQSLDERQ